MALSDAGAQDSAGAAGSAARGSSALRTVTVVVLLILGLVAAFSANATVWANRTVFRTDNFIATANRVLDEPAVQDRLATRLTTRLLTNEQVKTLLRDELPDRAQFLAPVILEAMFDSVHDIILRLLQSNAVQTATDAALTGVHTQVIRFLEDEGALTIADNNLVIDLRVVLERAAQELGFSGERLTNLNLPDDAGKIVLIEDADRLSAVRPVIAEHNTIAWASVILAIVLFAAAVLVARSRRITLRAVGFVLVLCGLLYLLALYAARPVVAGFAQSPEVARDAFDAFVQDLRLQSLFIIVVGIAIIALTLLMGESSVARAIRRGASDGGRQAGAGIDDAIRENAPALRIGGYIGGVLALVLWPEPTTRVYITIFVLLGLYLLALWVLASDSSGAASVRGMLASSTGSLVGGGTRSNTSFVGRNAAYFRGAGILIAILAVIVVPDLTLGTLAAIVAITLIYLSLIEWLAAERAGEEPGARV